VTVPCQGATTTATLDAADLNAFDPDGDPLSYLWQSCPGAYLTDPTSPITDIVIDTSLFCGYLCGIRLKVTDSHGAYFLCRTYIQVIPGGQGCTPGYWKNHPESWVGTGYAPTDDFDTVFGVDIFDPDRTLFQAIRHGGGGWDKLGRFAVADLLNAAHLGVQAPHSIGYYISGVRAAEASGSSEPTATNFAADAELGCPLN
jgi:hypothetical protein